MAKIVKVRVLGETIPVNIASWALTFGIEETAEAVSKDVKSYLQNIVQTLPIWDEVTDGYIK